MSIDTTTSVEITPSIVETSIQASEDIVTSNTHEVWTQELNSLVDVVKKEYAIVGDALFASVEANETPYWLSVLIDNTVDNAIATGLSDYNALRQDVANAIASIDVASNAYVENINFDSDVDSRITSRLTTLDATYQAQFATKVELTTAVANTESALAQDIANLSVSFNNDLTTQVNNITTAYAAADASIASDITALQSSFASQAGDISANASTLSGLQTFVGVDSTNLPNGTGLNSIVTSHSTAFTNLENSVTGPSGDVAYSLSNLEQRSAAYADTEGARVENKFSYNSTINLNGQFHEAGFGIGATGSGTGTELDPFQSEFWINAEKFKFTNTNQTGQSAPFTIDASGITPQVTFNGVVNFTNTNMDAYDNSLVSISYNALDGKDVLAQQLGYANYSALQSAATTGSTVISGGYLNTDLVDAKSINASKINTVGLVAENIKSTSVIEGNVINSVQINSSQINGSRILGSVIEGGVFIGGTDVTLPTEFDTGVEPRSLCYATGVSYNITSTGIGSGFSIQTVPIPSASYAGDGISTYEGYQVYTNFSRYYPVAIRPTITASLSPANTADPTTLTYVDIILYIKLNGVTQRTLTKTVQLSGSGTYSGSIAEGGLSGTYNLSRSLTCAIGDGEGCYQYDSILSGDVTVKPDVGIPYSGADTITIEARLNARYSGIYVYSDTVLITTDDNINYI